MAKHDLFHTHGNVQASGSRSLASKSLAEQRRFAELQEEQKQAAKHDVFPARSYVQASGSKNLAYESRAKQIRFAKLQEEQEQGAKQASGHERPASKSLAKQPR